MKLEDLVKDVRPVTVSMGTTQREVFITFLDGSLMGKPVALCNYDLERLGVKINEEEEPKGEDKADDDDG